MATNWESQISGPIPSHNYQHSKQDFMVYTPNRERRNVTSLEVEGRRCDYQKNATKDYLRENVKRMRELQKASKMRDEDRQKPVKSTWRSSRYDCVESKVAQFIYKPQIPKRPASACNPRRPFSGNQSELVKTDESSNKPPKLMIRANSARELREYHKPINFIKCNAQTAKLATFRRSASTEHLEQVIRKKEKDYETYVKYQKGKVPDYLVHRREQESLAEAEWLANQPEPDQPPGHRKMPEHERQETLSLLKKTEKELLMELCKLPIRTDTLRVRKRKEEIESRLTELEDAIKIFSKPKVYVKID